MEAIEQKELVKGGEFLIKDIPSSQVFIPEEFGEEQRMMAQTCLDFIEKEITPNLREIEAAKDPSRMAGLLAKAGELGLLAVGVPIEYEGFGMDFNSSMLVAESVGGAHSFAVAISAHTGIGTLPIQYYGNEAQKSKYLPKLATGEWKACYCLTEPDSGSDANSGKTKAVLTEDGKHYILNGQKMWITNGGFADLLIVFAKIGDDKRLTAFIVERTYEGITMNEPEKKLGISGSDTRQVFFTDCKVPVENMLSERENGFKIAVNILNIGRVKLGSGVLGGVRTVTTHSIKYSTERKQFGVSINSFGAIKAKLAEMATKAYVSESLCYRAGQDIENKINALEAEGMEANEAKLKGVEAFAIECAIAKVQCSEVLDYVVDQGVQIYGGMGYSADAPMERAYRDARISRIYEGTNEINRMLMVGMLLKRAMKGEINFFDPAMAVSKELISVPSFETIDTSELFAAEKEVLIKLKKVFLMVGGKAAMTLQDKIEDEQEIMMNLADVMIEIYASESAILRTEKLVSIRGEEACKNQIAMSQIYLSEAVDKINTAAKEAIGSFTKGDEQKVMLMGLKRFTKSELYNTKELRRQIADYMIDQGKYPF